MDFTSTQLTTQRLVLRKLKESDSKALFEIYSDDLVMQFWSEKPFEDEQQACELIDQRIQSWDDGESVCLALEDNEAGLLIGTVSLFSFNTESRRAELGYMLSRSCWGGGMMSEALAAVLEFAFCVLNLNRLEADIDPLNLASARLLRRMGFSAEGLLKERWIVDGVVADSEMYGLLKKDYLRQIQAKGVLT